MKVGRKEVVAKCPLVEITLLHRAMRLELESMCKLAEDTATGHYNILLKRLKDFDVVFSSHSAVEDDFLFPAMAQRGATDLLASASQEHLDETILMRKAHQSVQDCCTSTINQQNEKELQEKAQRAMRELKEKLSEHMLREEDSIFPCLAAFTEPELKTLVADVLGSRPADVLETTLRMQFKHLDHEHGIHLFQTMRIVTKNTNFEHWLRHILKNQPIQKQVNIPPQPLPSTSPDESGKHRRDFTKNVINCPFFGPRLATLIAPCCQNAVCCHRCHDTNKTCPIALDRTSVKTMICTHCALEQPLASTCANCSVRVADYYCDICRHLDSTGTPLFHCPYCNICREGHGLGIDYHHCMNCNLCVLLEHKDSHFCLQHAGGDQPACAICTLSFFHSRDHVDLLPCGHPKHSDCTGSCTICAADTVALLRTSNNIVFPLSSSSSSSATTKKGTSVTASHSNLLRSPSPLLLSGKKKRKARAV